MDENRGILTELGLTEDKECEEKKDGDDREDITTHMSHLWKLNTRKKREGLTRGHAQGLSLLIIAKESKTYTWTRMET